MLHFKLISVVSLPMQTFAVSGTTVKCSVLFMRKLVAGDVEMMNDAISSAKDSATGTTKTEKQASAISIFKKAISFMDNNEVGMFNVSQVGYDSTGNATTSELPAVSSQIKSLINETV